MAVVAVFALGLAIAPRKEAYLSLLMPMAVALARFAPSAQIKVAFVVLALLVGVEIVLGEPVHLSLYLPVAIALSGPIWTCQGWWKRPRPFALLGLICVSIAAFYIVPWTSRKPFLHSLFSIKSGTTVADVRRKMAGCMVDAWANMTPPDATRGLTYSGSLIFRHSKESRFNADLGVVTFRDGKVVSVEFLPD